MNTMKKTVCATIVCFLLFLSGCARAPLDDATRLKKDIVVGGRNVSAMTVAEARAALHADAQERLASRKMTLLLPNGQTIFTAATLGGMFDVESALQQAAQLHARGGNRRIEMQPAIDEDVLDAVLGAYVDQYERPAQDASFSVDSARATPVTYRVEQTGVSIDREALKTAVMDALADETISEITVPCQTIAPSVTLASIQQRNALIAQYETSFASSAHGASNRVYNMKKAASAINGLVLQADESFDCNAVLGERTAENGWKLAPGIRNGKYEDEYGGGVCQISSTLFNAVMMADLTVTERHPHSWPMGYVEIGRDATISTGGKNFRFINSSGAPITLYLYVDSDKKTVTASIYGKPLEGGAFIDVVSEKTGTLETAGEVLMLDESLPSNTRLVEREARDGKTSATYKEYRAADGTLLRRALAYEDTYRAIDGLVYVSTDLYYGQSDEQDPPQNGDNVEDVTEEPNPGEELSPEPDNMDDADVPEQEEADPTPDESTQETPDDTDVPNAFAE